MKTRRISRFQRLSLLREATIRSIAPGDVWTLHQRVEGSSPYRTIVPESVVRSINSKLLMYQASAPETLDSTAQSGHKRVDKAHNLTLSADAQFAPNGGNVIAHRRT